MTELIIKSILRLFIYTKMQIQYFIKRPFKNKKDYMRSKEFNLSDEFFGTIPIFHGSRLVTKLTRFFYNIGNTIPVLNQKVIFTYIIPYFRICFK